MNVFVLSKSKVLHNPLSHGTAVGLYAGSCSTLNFRETYNKSLPFSDNYSQPKSLLPEEQYFFLYIYLFCGILALF